MEKKSIGAFIAALRKANGLTQKDLAEMLNVSDKTISRWECDDGTPDLSLIPVIAEIFGVSCDELLRGERKSPDERSSDSDEDNYTTVKGRKQRKRLLDSNLIKYKNRSCIAMGIALIGLVVAMILNLGFLSAIIGFALGLIFLIVSVICQSIFTNNALAAVAGTEEDEDLYNYKKTVVTLAEKSFGLDVFILGVIFPLVFVAAYLGLSTTSWLTYGLATAIIFLAVYLLICWVVNARLVKQGTLKMSEEAGASYWQKHQLQKKYGGRLALILVITLVVQIVLNSIDKTTFVKGTEYKDYDGFVALMEDSSKNDNDDIDYEYDDGVIIYSSYLSSSDDIVELYFDENGNPASEEYVNSLDNIIFGAALTDSNGNILCKWVQKNETIIHIEYGEEENGYLPITVYDSEAVEQTDIIFGRINLGFVVLYLGEIVAAFIVYHKKAQALR